jgi:hypothetical protein
MGVDCFRRSAGAPFVVASTGTGISESNCDGEVSLGDCVGVWVECVAVSECLTADNMNKNTERNWRRTYRAGQMSPCG